MNSGELFQEYLGRVAEAEVYLDQGLVDQATEILKEILDKLGSVELTDEEKSDLGSRIESCLAHVDVGEEPPIAAPKPKGSAGLPLSSHPSESLQYGLALMDGQFWEEAITEFKHAAVLGENALRCWDLCGDCSCHLEQWEEAIHYYELVYTDPGVTPDVKLQTLLKITKCSQTQKKITAKSTFTAKSETAAPQPNALADHASRPRSVETLVPSVTSLDQSSVIQLLGRQVCSWAGDSNIPAQKESRSYRILNLLHVGITSMVVELEVEETGKRLAGQTLTAPYNRHIRPEALAKWIEHRMMTDSQHLIKVFDLAHHDDIFFIVREYYPLSLVDLLSKGRILPVPLAVSIAYHILEGLGDLHLRMGKDDKIRNIFHLDLRPSRVLLRKEKPGVKISNGGLWKILETSNPDETSIKRLPLPVLSYRAPEQFRTYLARKKPPVFTDIYLFGALFYEMLTGIPAFQAASLEEYEIQHCEQYPTPPKVWRSEIPEELNDMIMKCLERDPFKRWRSTTQMSLILEKSFSHLIHSVRDGLLNKFLDQLEPNGS